MDELLIWWLAAAEAGVLPDVEFVGSEYNGNTTVTIPAGHQSGDLMVMVAYITGIGTPTPPGGSSWSAHPDAQRTGFSNKNFIVYSKIATSGSETSGTWTDTFGLTCHVYRNASGLGAGAFANDGNSNPDLPSITLDVSDGSSWVMGWALQVSSTNALSPSGMTDREEFAAASTRVESWDTNAGVSSFAGKTDIGSANQDFVSMAVEILKAT